MLFPLVRHMFPLLREIQAKIFISTSQKNVSTTGKNFLHAEIRVFLAEHMFPAMVNDNFYREKYMFPLAENMFPRLKKIYVLIYFQ